MIGGDPEFFLRHMFGTLLHDEDAIEPAAWTEYLRCFLHSETIRATCDEYHAGASIDLVHDHADLSEKGSGHDLLRVWRDHASDVRGHGIESGHFIAEERPDHSLPR
jgi:haloacetate dehalogenase